MSDIPAPTTWITKTPREVSRGVLYQFWQQLKPEYQAELCKPAKNMLHVKGLPGMGEATVPLRLLALYQAMGQAHYSDDACAKAAMDNALGQIYREGKLITDWRELSPQGDKDGLPKAVRTNGAMQPTAKLWIPSFSLPKEGEKVADYAQFCIIRDAIAHDYAQFTKAKAEVVQLADIALGLCEEGQKKLAAIAPGWAVVGEIAEEVKLIETAIAGLKALKSTKPAIAAALQLQEDELATAMTHLAAATREAQEGKVWVLESPAKDATKKGVGKKAAGD